jgi:hypothetical protein
MSKSIRAAAVLLALALAPATLWAQDTGTTMDLGVKVGVNLATLNGQGESPGRRTGFIGGAHLTISLPNNSMFYFQPELLYSQKGFSESVEGNSATLALDYIDLPVLVGVKFDNGGSVTPRIFAGPQASFKMSCKLKGDAGGDSASIDCGSDLIGEVFDAKGVLFDLLFGAGVDFDMGSLDIVFDARYDLGLTDALDLGDSKMSAWQFLAGVAFPLGN